jgi:hypothetical protein
VISNLVENPQQNQDSSQPDENKGGKRGKRGEKGGKGGKRLKKGKKGGERGKKGESFTSLTNSAPPLQFFIYGFDTYRIVFCTLNHSRDRACVPMWKFMCLDILSPFNISRIKLTSSFVKYVEAEGEARGKLLAVV